MQQKEVSQERSALVDQPLHHVSKKTHIQDRAIVAGNFVVINGYRVNLALLRQRFTEGGYQVHEAAHFLLFLRMRLQA
jgi:hypothetical protein